jgi:hypothetical protein
MSRPNSACSRRRQRRFTNVYSFAWPWRSMSARSAARLRRTVGPLSPRNVVAGQTRQRDIIGHHQAYSGHIPDIFRAYFGYEMIIACGIARRRIRRPVGLVACGIVRRRIACRRVRRVRYRPSPDRVPSGSSPDRLSSRPGPPPRPHVSAVVTVGRAERPSSAMSRPNSRL